MKSPPVQFTDEQAHENTEAFIAGTPGSQIDWTVVLERAPRIVATEPVSGR